MLPFTREQFAAAFVWPTQFVAYLLGLAMVAAVLRPWTAGHRLVSAGLAWMWLWTGVAYHGLFIATINPAALAFGALCVLQGALFAYLGVARHRRGFGPSAGPAGWLGWGMVVYAAMVYPVLGAWAGHGYPQTPTFGITPCPVALFTFGLLLLTMAPVPRAVLAMPLARPLLKGSAAFLLSVAQDWPLLFSGIAAVLLVRRDRRRRVPALP